VGLLRSVALAYLRRFGFTSASCLSPWSACRSSLGVGSPRISAPTRRNASSRRASALAPVSANHRFAAFRARATKRTPATLHPSDRQRPWSSIAAWSPSAWRVCYLAQATCQSCASHRVALRRGTTTMRMARWLSASASGLAWSFSLIRVDGERGRWSSETRGGGNGRPVGRFPSQMLCSGAPAEPRHRAGDGSGVPARSRRCEKRDPRGRPFSPFACTILRPKPYGERKAGRRPMSRWLLAPTDCQADVWKTYAVQRIVVEAPDERTARKQVAAAAPRTVAPDPWLDPALTTCEQVDDGGKGAPAGAGAGI
jgi:hypothetical protein